jgi:hypothetical protein
MRRTQVRGSATGRQAKQQTFRYARSLHPPTRHIYSPDSIAASFDDISTTEIEKPCISSAVISGNWAITA